VFELTVPASTAELRRMAGSGLLIAGGTDILVQMRAGRDVPRLIDMSSLSDSPPPVRSIEGWVEISASAPITKVIEGLSGRLPGLAASARRFGSLQIRNRATIGGNIANASPAADMLPPLVAAGAVAVVEGPSSQRVVPVSEIAAGPGRTSLESDEWISVIRVPLPEGEEGFTKLGGRAAQIISIVNLAWRWTRRPDGTLSEVRLAAGAVAPTVGRAIKAEAELEGRRPEPSVVDQAVAALRASITPIDDLRAGAWYRREMAGNLLRSALAVPSEASA
jgi:CO/xanthine dehydrogenase FAD-binding subunit